MILSMPGQVRLFLITVVIGLAAGCVYDALRLLRHYIRHASIIIHLEDLLYWLFLATVVFYVFLNENYGEIRGFCVLGTFLGMILYFALLSPFVLKAVKAVLAFLYKVAAFVFGVLAKPFRLLYRLLLPVFGFITKKAKKICDNIKKQLQNIAKYVKIMTGKKLRSVFSFIKHGLFQKHKSLAKKHPQKTSQKLPVKRKGSVACRDKGENKSKAHPRVKREGV